MSDQGVIKPAGRREQILATALDLFAEHGVEHVSTRRIAAAVGISQPSLYAHFGSSDEIAAELCCRGFDRLHALLTDAAAAGGSPRERLHRLGSAYIGFGLDHPAIYRVAFMMDLRGDAAVTTSPVLAAGVRAFEVLSGLIRTARGGDAMTAEAIAQSAWASMHGLVALLLVRHEFPWVERERLIDLHLRAVVGAAFD